GTARISGGGRALLSPLVAGGPPGRTRNNRPQTIADRAQACAGTRKSTRGKANPRRGQVTEEISRFKRQAEGTVAKAKQTDEGYMKRSATKNGLYSSHLGTLIAS